MSTQAIHIKHAAEAPLSPVQKRFNRLIKQIDKQKKLLADWQETMQQSQQEALEKLEPIRVLIAGHQTEMVRLLDQYADQCKFTAKQMEKITYLITEICDELIRLHGCEDLKPLYNKYNELDYDTQLQEIDEVADDFMQEMMEEVFGVEIGEDGFDFDFNDPSGAAEQLFGRLDDLKEQAAAKYKPRKKTARQLAKEAREAEEEAKVSKSIQAVYRQLVTALHPDREPDDAERRRKTEIMQKVTVAYSKRDLLKLLELQMEAEQISQDNINAITEERLNHYNKVLKKQLDELNDEVLLTETHIKMQLQISPFQKLTPKSVMKMLWTNIISLQIHAREIQKDLEYFQDLRNLKKWLNNYRIPESEFDLYDIW